MSGTIEGEGPKVIDLNADGSKAEAPVITEAEAHRQQKIMQKQATIELADYKKRLRASNEIKQLQVDEMRLGVEYYKYRKEFRDLQPAMEELDALMEAEAKEEKARQKKEYDDYVAEQKKFQEEKEKKPSIIQPKTGKARK